jgi:hypothetical protein
MPDTFRHSSGLLCTGSRRSAGDRINPVHPDRHCPDCGADRSFEQHHGPAGWCPDTDDRCCPEWYCLTCGAALLIGASPVTADLLRPAEIRDRVA